MIRVFREIRGSLVFDLRLICEICGKGSVVQNLSPCHLKKSGPNFFEPDKFSYSFAGVTGCSE